MHESVDILIFGGAFDPPHVGHTTVVEEVITTNQAEQVVVMPVGQHPFAKQLSPAKHRLAMVQKAFGPLRKLFPNRILIDTFELTKTEVSYTYHTLLEYKQRFPTASIGLLIGSDNLESFSSWKYSSSLRKEFLIFVYPRQGYPVPSKEQTGIRLLTNVSVVASSSTAVRSELKATGSSEHISGSVLEYILDHNLLQYWHDDS